MIHRILTDKDFMQVMVIQAATWGIGLADIELFIKVLTGLTGFCYLLWKWRKEYKKK